MAIDMEEYNEVKKNAARLQREADQAEGAYQQAMKTLKKDFDCDDLEEAGELLQTERTEEDDAEEAYKEALSKYKVEWNEFLNKADDDES